MKLHTRVKANSQVSFLPIPFTCLSPEGAVHVRVCIPTVENLIKKTSPRRPSDVLLYDPTQVDN